MSYHLVHHPNGSTSVAFAGNGEVMHPTVGPELEARTLYVEGLRLIQRLEEEEHLVVWDIGMGAAANALAVIEALHQRPGAVDLVSFDHTDEALRFALAHDSRFPLIRGHRNGVQTLLEERRAVVGSVTWSYLPGDFPQWLGRSDNVAAPHAVLFDAWSPKSNPGMWTLAIFQEIRSRVAARAALATYSRATCIRAALLLAGFHVGRGPAIGVKEETTLAATHPEDLKDPLPPEWLGKAQRSHSGRPLEDNTFRQAPLSPGQLRLLCDHPQFRS
jgi:tRNA U34 5-methylaminomethyl-2-thiouridine-forming methyltransferase MnmC